METKKIVIQIQPEFLADDACELVFSILKSIENDDALSSDVKFSYDKKEIYVNVEIECSNISRLWKTIKKRLITNNSNIRNLTSGIVIVCQGESGWDDYLLLYHSDPLVPVDKIKNGVKKRMKMTSD